MPIMPMKRFEQERNRWKWGAIQQKRSRY
uniref:Uncharacterized protein n=1 Tax=Rhizophora mucronata TaxID=61149 RepID=A0A2P2N9J0_RHIMU